jgi:hypothetical protein
METAWNRGITIRRVLEITAERRIIIERIIQNSMTGKDTSTRVPAGLPIWS